MKKYILWVLCPTLLLLFMASCLGNDDNKSSATLSEQEAAHYLKAAEGNYIGSAFIHYYTRNRFNMDSIASDSVKYVDLRISAADSCGIITMPARLLAFTLSDGHDMLRKGLENGGYFTMKMKLAPYRITSDGTYYAFQFTPYEGLSFNVNYEDGSTHKVTMAYRYSTTFDSQLVNTTGIYGTQERALEFYLLPYTITVDDSSPIYLINSVFHYYAKH